MYSQVSLILLNYLNICWCGQHHSQSSIFTNLINSLKYLTFSSVRAVFCRSLPGFRSIADPRSSTCLHIAFTEQSFQPFSGNFATTVRYPKPSFRNVSMWALSSYDILPRGNRPNCDWFEILKNVLQCYVAPLRVNIKIMTSQQSWYLLLNYFNNNKINFLFSCEICSWSLHFRQFDECQVNTAQSNALVHYCEFLGKNIQSFLRYSNFPVGVFYFASPCIYIYVTLFLIRK